MRYNQHRQGRRSHTLAFTPGLSLTCTVEHPHLYWPTALCYILHYTPNHIMEKGEFKHS